MNEESAVRIRPGLSIPRSEIGFVASRSGGPGGQHVNKVSSRVSLLFDVRESRALSAAQKRRIEERLATRINRDGVLRVTAQRHRSQAANRLLALERFATLLSDALHRRRARKSTAVPAAERDRRMREKRRRSEIKRTRSRWSGDE